MVTPYIAAFIALIAAIVVGKDIMAEGKSEPSARIQIVCAGVIVICFMTGYISLSNTWYAEWHQQFLASEITSEDYRTIQTQVAADCSLQPLVAAAMADGKIVHKEKNAIEDAFQAHQLASEKAELAGVAKAPTCKQTPAATDVKTADATNPSAS